MARMILDAPPALTMDKSLDAPFLDELRTVEVRPVFIVGLRRSGTTLLYRLLAETGCFNVTTVHHILNRHRLLWLHATGQDHMAKEQLNKLFESKGIPSESRNSRDFNADVLEEYNFALDHQGRRPKISPTTLDEYMTFFKKVQFVQNQSHPLLLKNPYDTECFRYIAQVIPQARFVFIHRNPLNVISSRVVQSRILLARRFAYHSMFVDAYRELFDSPLKLRLVQFILSERLPVLTELVCRDVALNCDYVLKHFARLGDRAMGITYSELCANPNQSVRTIMDFLGVQEESPRDFSEMVRTREPAVLPEVERRRRRIETRNAAYLRAFHV